MVLTLIIPIIAILFLLIWLINSKSRFEKTMDARFDELEKPLNDLKEKIDIIKNNKY